MTGPFDARASNGPLAWILSSGEAVMSNQALVAKLDNFP
jgi:hypothetical protein